MNEPSPSIWLPKPALTDEATAQLLDFLHEFTAAFENAYYDQLHRYYAKLACSEPEQPPTEPLNPSDDPV